MFKLRNILYKPNKTYWINIKKIKIQEFFRLSKIKDAKWKRKTEYYLKTGRLPSKIILNRDFVLLDGYAAYLIALSQHWRKVPVEFVNTEYNEIYSIQNELLTKVADMEAGAYST